MHAQQQFLTLTVGNINLQVISFFLQLLNQEECDRVEKVYRPLLSGITINVITLFTSKYILVASTCEKKFCKQNGLYLILLLCKLCKGGSVRVKLHKH